MKKPIETPLYLKDLSEEEVYYGLMSGDDAIREELIINKEEYIAYINGVSHWSLFDGGYWRLLGLILNKNDLALFKELLPVIDFTQRDKYNNTFLEYCIENDAQSFFDTMMIYIKDNNIPFSVWGLSMSKLQTDNTINKSKDLGYNSLLCTILNADDKGMGLILLPLIEGNEDMAICRRYLNMCFNQRDMNSTYTLDVLGDYMRKNVNSFKEIKSNFFAMISLFDSKDIKSSPNYKDGVGVSDEFFEELYLLYEVKKNSTNQNKKSLKI